MQISSDYKIKDVLKRLQDNVSRADIAKACFGMLVVMARDSGNKSFILIDGKTKLWPIVILIICALIYVHISCSYRHHHFIDWI